MELELESPPASLFDGSDEPERLNSLFYMLSTRFGHSKLCDYVGPELTLGEFADRLALSDVDAATLAAALRARRVLEVHGGIIRVCAPSH
ncbi:MAG: hypothetical protein AAFR38_10395 [Planctomycetota bacterium]